MLTVQSLFLTHNPGCHQTVITDNDESQGYKTALLPAPGHFQPIWEDRISSVPSVHHRYHLTPARGLHHNTTECASHLHHNTPVCITGTTSQDASVAVVSPPVLRLCLTSSRQHHPALDPTTLLHPRGVPAAGLPGCWRLDDRGDFPPPLPGGAAHHKLHLRAPEGPVPWVRPSGLLGSRSFCVLCFSLMVGVVFQKVLILCVCSFPCSDKRPVQ